MFFTQAPTVTPPAAAFGLTAPEHALNFLVALATLFVIDAGLISPFVKSMGSLSKSEVKATRWFFLHFVANFGVCVTAAVPLFYALSDPYNALNFEKFGDTSFFGSASVWPLTIVNAVHVYHMVGGFNLNGGDYFHHLLFIPLLGFPGQVLPWGTVQASGAFFISGLPGGLTYLQLGLGAECGLDPSRPVSSPCCSRLATAACSRGGRLHPHRRSRQSSSAS